MTTSTDRPALIVEDELYVLLEIEEVVGSITRSFQSCSSVAGALTWLESKHPSFAVVDYRLRDATSETLVARLRDLAVPTLIYSGNEFSSEFDDPVMASFKWLAKPISPQALKLEILKLVASND